MFGSNLLSDRNVPAGDEFVKIDVNSFPVLTLHEERNSKTSLSLARSHTHTHTRTHKIDGWGKNMKSCAFVLSMSNRLIENHPSS